MTCAPVISQYAAMGGLEMARNDVNFFRDQFIRRQDLICSRLDKLSDYFRYAKPDGAYFLFVKLLGNVNSKEFSFDLLKNAQVATVPGISFGPEGEGYIRFNFGVSESTIIKAFDRIEKYLLKKTKKNNVSW